LADIYADLKSPFPSLPPDNLLVLEQLAKRVFYSGHVHGLRSTLFTYQRETVATMLCHEMDGISIPDPLYVPLSPLPDLNQYPCFYIQPSTLEILRDRPRISMPRGGILCEELGMSHGLKHVDSTFDY
jgi:hypothetical protein